MALQVWLPLNDEDVRNQGLADVTITNNGATYNSSGKIGGCWNIPSSTNSISLVNYMNVLKTYNNYSMCAWVYITDEPNGHSASILSSGTWSGTNNCLCFGFYNYDSGFNRLLIPSKGTWKSYIDLSNKIVLNTWYHVAISYDGSKTIGYINGEYVGESSLGGICENSSSNNLKIGGVTYTTIFGLRGNINDVRIYDHCLSEDEIHELSLGKIGHWKLNDAEIEPTTNILNSVTITCYNEVNGKYGYSTESNVLKIDGEFQNKQCTKIYPATNGDSWRPYTYLPALVSNGGTDPKYKTLQFDYYSTTSTFLNPYKLGSGSSTARWKCINSTGVHTGSGTNNINITVNPNEWNHVEIIFEGTSSERAQWGYIKNGAAVTSSSNTYHLYANVMVEEKDHSTPYTKTSREKGNVPDISGNHHDLTVSGDPILNDDSARYDKSTLFDGSNYLSCTSPTAEAKTLSLWAYVESIPASAVLFADYKSKLALGFYSSGTRLITRCGVTSTMGSTDLVNLNSWNHFCVVNGETNQLYINGQAATMSGGNNWTHSTDTLMIGRRSASSYGFTDKISDVRLYATALSADDVQKLYKLGNV